MITNPNADKCFLKIKDGRFMTVRKLPGTQLKLCAVESQNGGQTAQRVVIVKNTSTQVAFFFQCGHGDHYLLMVEGGTLKLKRRCSITDTLSDEYWFQKVNLKSGEHYCLRTVVEPSLYLCGPSPEKPRNFFLGTNNEQCALVKEEIEEAK